MRTTHHHLILLAFVLPAPALAWDPSTDAKPVEELQLMTDDGLNGEARRACIGAAVARDVERSRSVEAQTEYLDTLMRVARGKHQGQVPWWITAYQAAARTTDASGCADVDGKRLQEELAKAKEAEGRKSDKQ